MTAILHAPDVRSSSAFVREALNGWELAPIFTYGTPHFVDSNLTVGGLSASSLPAGTIPAGDVTTGTDPRLYVPSPTLSGIGAESPGGVRVPFLPTANLPLGRVVRLDGRLTKRFSLPGERTIELSFEAINALNHALITDVQQTAYKSIWDSTAKNGYIQAQKNLGVASGDNGFPDGTSVRRAEASVRYIF